MFVRDEIALKKRQIRELIETLGLGGIYIKRHATYAWLTGGGCNYVGIASEVGVSGALITPDAEYILANNIEAPRMIEEEGVEEQGYRVRTFPWYRDGEPALLAELVKGPLGADTALPGSRDIAADVAGLRYSLTPWEVERYRTVGDLTSAAIEETAAGVRPGDREKTVVGRLAARLWDMGLDYITIFCAADDRIGRFRHPLATERQIDKRAMLCVNARQKGLIVSLTRFVQFGKVPVDIRKLYDATVRIDNTLIANTVPGRPVAEIFRTGVEAYKAAGYPGEEEKHHQGGAIGYEGRDYKVNAGSPQVVQENQAFAWNPTITGAKSEDTMLATTGGPVLLSHPVSFPVLAQQVEGRTFERPDILEI